MPPRGWKTLSVREDVWARLRKFMEEENIVSESDAVALLLGYRDIAKRLDGIAKTLTDVLVVCRQVITDISVATDKSVDKAEEVFTDTSVNTDTSVKQAKEALTDISVKPTVRVKKEVLKNPEAYFAKVSKLYGRDVLWVECPETVQKSRGIRYVYVFKDELEQYIKQLNTLPQQQKEKELSRQDIELLHKCGLIYESNGEWKIVE